MKTAKTLITLAVVVAILGIAGNAHAGLKNKFNQWGSLDGISSFSGLKQSFTRMGEAQGKFGELKPQFENMSKVKVNDSLKPSFAHRTDFSM